MFILSPIQKLRAQLKNTVPSAQIFTDPLYTLVKGTDAGFYRLIPQAVIRVENETEVVGVMKACSATGHSVTFKGGGTSLSGQTISRDVLIEIGDGFSSCQTTDGNIVNVQCGMTGAHVNNRLARYGRRIGPDPSSILSAKIGGIVANNASGGAFGIQYNSYTTLRGMRLILADGFILDTRDEDSRNAFSSSHSLMIRKLEELALRVKSDPRLYDRINRKYALKNTCGYGLNSLIDFVDPMDILCHLMVGSEGTLGFISEVSLQTVPEYPFKATTLVFFSNLREACEVTGILHDCRVTACELMDRNSLRAVENRPGMPEILKSLGNDTAALLIDTAAQNKKDLISQVSEIKAVLEHAKTLFPLAFTTDRLNYEKVWKVRKGLFTSAAAARPAGTACIIEDLAFSREVIADAVMAVREVTEKYGYHNTVIWGHIMDGNIHFVITPDFEVPGSLENYDRFMHEIVNLVVHRFDGSLKGEHGTGRNMAPFVKEEWGNELYGVMQEIKQILDPQNMLNPGVILNDDPGIHLKNIKTYPLTDPLIDSCIECGFCEVSCPSRSLTLTPRQRIVALRELTRVNDLPRERSRLRFIRKSFRYAGDATCATDGLCAISCPVEINTGTMIKELRFQSHGKLAHLLASGISSNMRLISAAVRVALSLATRLFIHQPYMPAGARLPKMKPVSARGNDRVVYFATCINRSLGKSADYGSEEGVIMKTESLLRKAGFQIIYPENIHGLCCGMAFDSKGFRQQGKARAGQLETALLKATDHGRYPVYCDMSPCVMHMKQTLDKRLKLYDPVSFILEYFPGRLSFRQLDRKIAIHSTCSNTKMGLETELFRLASMCATSVLVPEQVGCCGWAGDRGFIHPELNASALKNLRSQITEDIRYGYSTSRTCEIGLSKHSGICYKSIVYLVDEATE